MPRADGLDDSFADELAKRIDQTVQQLLQERGGGMLTAWVGWFDYLDKDGDTMFAWCSPDEQRLSASAGLSKCLEMSIEHQMRRTLERGEEED